MSRASRPRPRPRDLVIVAFAGIVTALLAAHSLVPDPLGTLLDSFAPWIGLAVPIGAIAGLAARSTGTAALLVPAVVWAATFVPGLAATGATGGDGDLRVVTQNMYAQNSTPRETLEKIKNTGAEVVGLQEITRSTRTTATAELGGEYPHHATMGTVGVWSRYPIVDRDPVDLGLSWTRALRVSVRAPSGPVAVYVAHLPSLRPDLIEKRNRGLGRLAETVRRDETPRVVLLGDLNTAGTDRRMSSLTSILPNTAAEATSGFGFTWPDALPMVRLDHVLSRGLRMSTADVIDGAGSDHRGVVVTLTS